MKNFWSQEDFDVFTVEGLDNRMSALQKRVQPKFARLGDFFSDKLSSEGLDEFYPHVAKHARRTVNPPTDSWVAFAPAKRGYKALPHFQIGLWESHLFIIIAVIYENSDKKVISERLINEKNAILQLPEHFIVSGDHMKPEAHKISEIEEDGLIKLLNRLATVKKAEFLIGTHLDAHDAIEMTEKEFFTYVEDTFNTLIPFYKTIIGYHA